MSFSTSSYIRLLLLGALVGTGSRHIQAQSFTLIGRQPAANAHQVPLSAPVQLTFSQEPDTATVKRLAIYSGQAGGRKRGTYAVAGTGLTFTPATAFKPGETLRLSAPPTLRSATGNALLPQVFQFTAAAGGTGRGNFAAATSVARPDLSAGLAIGDVDGDGDVDVVNANGTGNTIQIALNGGDASGSATGVFSNGRTVPVAGRPGAVALADVDGDGDLDLLAANTNSPTVSVRLNGGDATGSNTGIFSGNQNVAVSNPAQAVAVGDVDGDGDLDLLTASQTGGVVSVRLNGGNTTGSNSGIFSGTQNLVVAAETSAILLADTDGDGDLDLLATNPTGGSVHILLNGGNATGSNTGIFTSTQYVSVGLRPTAVAVGDVDGDGDLDLAASNSFSSTVSIRLNSGVNSGNFGGSQEVAVGQQPGPIALADMDADGDLDLVAADTGIGSSPTLWVRLNGGDDTGSGQGIFSNGFSVAAGAATAVLATGDVDGDLDVDLLIASPSAGRLSIRLNQPPPPTITSFSPVSAPAGATVTLTGAYLTNATLSVGGATATVLTRSSTSLTFTVPAGAALGPVTATNQYGSTTSTVFTALFQVTGTTPRPNAIRTPTNSSLQLTFTESLNLPSAAALRVFSSQLGGLKAGTATTTGNTLTFNPTVAYTPGELINFTVPATIRSAGGLGTTGRVQQFTLATGGTGQANFRFSSDPVVGYNAPYQVAVADVDADGDLDLITANYDSGNGSAVNVLLNTGTGTFSTSASYSVGGYNSGVKGVSAADIDGDGDIDLLTANANASSVSVLLNDGKGVFSFGHIVYIGGSPYRLALADLDADGDLDLLSANFGANNLGSTISVRLNNGQGYLSGTAELTLGSGVSGVATADVDADGDLDIVASVFGDNTVVVRLNNGNATFGGNLPVAVGSGPNAVATADVDADGDMDILAANAGATGQGNTVSVRLNNGQGQFTAAPDMAVGAMPSALQLADVDADGDLDLLTANYGTNTVSIRLNSGTGTFTAGSDPVVDTNTYTRAGSLSLATGDLDGDGDLDFAAANSGNGTGSTVSIRLNQPAAPAILSFSPSSGAAGTTVTLTGVGFTGTSAVTFNGVSAAFTLLSATELRATVPATATTGPVAVTTPGGTIRSTQDFMVVGAFSVTSVVPARQQRNAPLTTPVSFTFSQPLVAGTTAVYVHSHQAGGRKAGTATVSTSTVALTPATPFKAGETVTAVLPAGVRSAGGQVSTTAQVLQFTTAAGAGSGLYPPLSVAATAQYNPFATTAADMNGDGLLDIVTLNYSASSSSVSIRFNTGPAQFSGTTNVSIARASTAFSIFDVDNDGDLDIVTVADNRLDVRLNTGTGTSFSSGSYVFFNATYNGTSFILKAGDLNGDGYLDLLVPGYGVTTVLILLNDKAGSFANSGRIEMNNGQPYMSMPNQVDIADVDLDGDMDCISINTNPNQLVVALNDSRAQFTVTHRLTLAASPSTLRMADVNNDNQQDALVGFRDQVQTLFGTTVGTFRTGPSVSVGVFPRTMALGDIDGDGDLDLVTANADSYSLSVRTNNGSGLFGGTTTLSASQNPSGVTLADLDGDTDLDVLMANYSDGTVSTSLNPGTLTPVAAPRLITNVQVFPNPAQQQFTLLVPPVAQSAQFQLSLRDINGRLVRTQQVQVPASGAQIQVDVRTLPSGVYIVEGTSTAQRFVTRLVVY